MSEVDTHLQPLLEDEDIDIALNQVPHSPPPRRRNWIITAVVLLLIILLAGGGAFAYLKLTAPPPVQFTQQAVTTGNLSVTISASGPIQANAEYDMNFTTSGQVNSINVHVGQQVKAGQKLATLNSTSLQDALTLAQQAVTNAQVTYNDAYNNGASQTTLDSDYNQLQTAQDQLKTAQDNLAAATLTAPANATVAAINGVKGEYIGSGSSSSSTLPFIILTDASKLSIAAQVNEADIASIQVGQPAQFTVTSYTNQTFRARVATIETVGQTTSNVVTYTVNLMVDQNSLNKTHLYPGMTATVNITTAQRIGVL
ncbi:MAG: efflux RND transporter periplasmic adaptor subunit, partial [Ktedonobacteraceae bacterium]